MVAEMFEWIMHLIWTFRLWILFGSTIPWTASVAEHGGIFCYIQLHQFPGLYQTWIDNGLSFQVSTDWSCPACCSCSNSTWRPSSGNQWWLRCLNESCTCNLDCKYCQLCRTWRCILRLSASSVHSEMNALWASCIWLLCTRFKHRGVYLFRCVNHTDLLPAGLQRGQ